MPRVPDGYLDSVVYLYPSALDANQGEAQGGSGCVVYVPSTVSPDRGYTYVVTNSHVLREGGCLTVRLNGKNANPVVHETAKDDWIHHPDGDDVAVCRIPGVLVKKAQIKVLSVDSFLTPAIIEQNEIGPGSDVFMAGRFIDYQGVQKNTPSLRFGNISMMLPEPIPHPRGFLQESFLVEMRSIIGYSGSPVTVYLPLLGSFGEITADTAFHMAIVDSAWLLGIVWGHTRAFEKVLQEDKETPVYDGSTVATNTGISKVVPVWKIRECLEVVQLADEREALDKNLEI